MTDNRGISINWSGPIWNKGLPHLPIPESAPQDAKYTIIYSGNGNTGGSFPGNQIATYKSPIIIRKNTGNLEKTGFTFGGWNTNADGAGIPYIEGQEIFMPMNGLILYAKWTAQGGTWTPKDIPLYSGIWKKVYMSKDIAQEYYNVISSESTLKMFSERVAEVGVATAIGKLAVKLAISKAAVGAVIGVLLFGYEVVKNIQKNELLDKVRNCPSNGFVAIEYWMLYSRGQMIPTIQHESASEIQVGTGSFQAGIYQTN